jgi:hypothetical protein
VKADPAHFDKKTGKVSRADREAPEKNEAIAAVAADVAKASRNPGKGHPAINEAGGEGSGSPARATSCGYPSKLRLFLDGSASIVHKPKGQKLSEFTS